METEKKQKVWAVVEHEIVPGLTETILLSGTIDGFGNICWGDEFQVLDGKCKFIALNLAKSPQKGEYIDAR